MAKTLLQITEEIQEDLDLYSSEGNVIAGNPFMPPATIKEHIRRAVKDAVALVHRIYEDYFLVNDSPLNIISGTSEYALPSGVFVNKFRRLFYNDGAKKYKIKRIINLNEIPYTQDTDDLRYVLVNKLGVGYRIKFYPTPLFNSATFVTLWYLRNAKELLNDSDQIDIPDEVLNYVLANAKFRCLQKDIGNPMRAEFKEERDEQKQILLDTLSNKVPDDEGGLYSDMSFYDSSIL